MVRAVVLRVIDGGRIVEERSVGLELLETVLRARGDLGTDWFGRILAAAFDAYENRIELKDTRGETKHPSAELRVEDPSFALVYGRYGWIGVGRGTTPPTRQDYKLEVPEMIRPAQGNYADGTGVAVLSAAFVFESDKDITEVGLFLCECSGEEQEPGTCILLDRTVLETPVHVSAGQTLYVEYRIAI